LLNCWNNWSVAVVNYETFCQIRDHLGRQQLTVAQTARALGLHPRTVAKWADVEQFRARAGVPRASKLDAFKGRIVRWLDAHPYSAQQIFQRLCEVGYDGGLTIVKHYVQCIRPCHYEPVLKLDFAAGECGTIAVGSTRRRLSLTEMRRAHWLEWLYLLERDQLPPVNAIDEQVRRDLLHRLNSTKGFGRQKALVVLAHQDSFSVATISRCLGVSRITIIRYLEKYRLGGVGQLFRRKQCPLKSNDEALKMAVFALLHEPPSLSNINRTTWKMDDFHKILAERGNFASKDVIRCIVKEAGFKWRKARTVLTSSDPEYREKIDRVHRVLANLRDDERFFSIDEFGPFAIKMTGGRVLCAPGIQPTVPQWQKSKGSIIMTAALELSRNHVTHFYSEAKNTDEMIKMTEILIDQYQDTGKLYLSWDAASWHISKALIKFIDEHNAVAKWADLPQIEAVPLPAGAQFLNVIESVFSGMARAIVHNSNYASKAEATEAMDRYFNERNQHFEEHPQRAGDKIWRLERTSATFHPSNNCKDPAYR